MSITQQYRVLASWTYRDGSYRGQLGLYWGTGFVRQDWLCLHRHRTREAATACAYAVILDVQESPVRIRE